MDHEDYYHTTSQRTMATGTKSHPPPSSTVSSSSPGRNTSWDAHYKRRGRTRERFDYALTSEELSPEVPPEYSTNADRPQQPRSADSRPQYHQHHPANASGASVSTGGNSSSSRATCLPHMFYPGEGNGMMMMPPSTVMGQQYDDEGIRYYPSERFNLPVTAAAPASESGAAYLEDNEEVMQYIASRQRAMGHMMPANKRNQGDMYDATFRERPESSAPYGISAAYQAAATRQAGGLQHHHRPGSLYHTREMKYSDYVKENLIMYGEGLQDAPSASTGLSQEELLQRKRREETWQKRREKRHQLKKNRVVNLPSTFFPTQSNRQQQQQQRQPSQAVEPEQLRYQDIARERRASFGTTTTTNRKLTLSAATEKPFEDGGFAGISYEKSKSMVSGRSSTGGGQQNEATQKDAGTAKAAGSNARGVRGLMVRRQRDDANSSGRRWKILPSLASKPKAEPSSPNRSRKQDPPASSASSRLKYPRDPPSVHSGKDASASGESKASGDDLVSAGNPSRDEFDRFMENPNLMTGTTPRSTSFIPHDERVSDELVLKTTEQTSPNRPSYASFTPKSGYASSRAPFSPEDKPVMTKKTSPTSVMDIQETGAIGVRWSENLFEQQFLSPDSARLDPYAKDEIRYNPRSKPKSILRKRASQGSLPSRRNVQDLFAVDEGKECPSDESPSKSPLRSGNIARMMNDPPTDDELGQASSPIGFFDGNGRSVSPILAESPSAEHDVVKTMAEWAGSHRNNSFDLASQYQEAAISNNYGMNNEVDEGQLSNSYVDFIEAVASVVIQTKVRQLLARIRVEKIRGKQILEQETRRLAMERDVSAMQRRSHAITQKARNTTKGRPSPKNDAALDFYTLAAIRIQAIFRGWWVRDCLAVDNYCATMIQKTYRGWLAVDASITKMYCIVRIQSIARGYLVRKRQEASSSDREVYDIAATIIQAQWRSFSCEMKFLRAYEDILVVQSVARGWITRRLIWSWLTTHHQNKSRQPRGNHEQFSRKIGKKPKKQPDVQSTPPRKPVEGRNGLSPSYAPHIEYMRKTLTLETEETGNLPAVKISKNAMSQVETMKVPFKAKMPFAREVLTNQKPEYQPSRDVRTPKNQFEQSRLKQTQPEIQASQEEVSAKAAKHTEESHNAKSEIEQRRKNKELEAKARQVEEKRRQEVQAAELAELEFRRKRMAMKAEARKKEEEVAAPVQEISTLRQDINPAPSDRSLYREEKKESDSYVNDNSIVTNPSDEPDESEIQISRRNAPIAPHSSGATNTIGPWQLKKRNAQPVSTPKPDVGNSKSFAEKHVDRQANLGNRPPFTRNGGVVAARKQQLFMAQGNGNFASEEVGVTSDDVAEMNSIVGKTPAEEPRHSSNAPGCIDDANELVAEAATFTPEKQHCNDDFSKTKDVDVSALTEPTTASPMATATASVEAPAKRVSGSTASYVQEMRSQRSEAEQKRLDEMHAIFTNAGLMMRTKRSY